MKKPLISAILSAALTLTACSSTETTPIAPKSEAAITTPVTTEPEKETASRTEAAAALPPEKKFPGDIELPVTYQHAENKKGKPCRSVMDGLEYEDFPAKEDIEPAIKCAFDNYFGKTNVYHTDENGVQTESPCTVENLGFMSGLYLDFNGDGEKESLIVIKSDSDVPFSDDSIVVYYCNEFDSAVFADDKLASGSNSISYLHALIYDDCIDIIVEDFFGATGQASAVYSFDNGFKKEFELGKGEISTLGTYIGSYGWYNMLSGYPPVYYIRTDKGYSRVGAEETGLDALIEKIPEMRTFIEMIEDYYGEKVVSVKTEGYLNFYFFMKDDYIRAYIIDDTLYSDFHGVPNGRFDANIYWEGETEYGLCLLQ